MEENYLLAIKHVSQRFSRDDKLFYFYVCALYGLLCKFSNYKDVVLRIFDKCKFYIEDGSITEILQRHDICTDEFGEDYIEDNECNMTYGVSTPGHEFYIDGNGDISYFLGDAFIACSLKNASIEHVLNTFCHEFSHLVKSEINAYEVDEDDKKIDYFIRTGFAYYYYSYDKEKDELSSSVDYSILDECINNLQTSDIMREIIGLMNFDSVDEGLDIFVSSLDFDVLTEDMGYDIVCDIVKVLWNNESFRSLVEDNIVENGVEDVEKFFDNIAGEGKLFELSELLEEAFDLSETPDNSDKINDLREKALKIVEIFTNNIKKMTKS